MKRHNTLMLLTGMTLFGCASAFGQTAPPVASIPDLSGIWGHSYFHFEPPSSGPGPVLTKLRRPDGTLILIPIVGDYSNPILGPQAVEVVKKRGEMELSGTVPPNPYNQCRPEPTPFTLSIQLGMQMIQQKDEVILLYLSDDQVRRVPMNVPHSAHSTPTWQGESVGHYEGDTLVIDTIGLQTHNSYLDWFRTPHSEKLHVVERFKLAADAKTLEALVKVDDSDTFNEPLYMMRRWRKVPNPLQEMVCAENNFDRFGKNLFPVPHADTPDF